MGMWQKMTAGLTAGLVTMLIMPVAMAQSPERIGVLYAVHGGAGTWSNQSSFDSAAGIFSYDENSVPWNLLWQPAQWGNFLNQPSAKFQGAKYEFQYPRLGGVDPFDDLTAVQLADMTTSLQTLVDFAPLFGIDADVEVFTDRMSWISTNPADMPNPRWVYYPQGIWGLAGAPNMTYCGSASDGGPWPGCDPERFNVDGAIDRMLDNDVDRIIVVDTTTTGVRFFKTFDQITVAQKVVDDYNTANGTSVTIEWVNDPTEIMAESYPLDTVGPFNYRWTASAGAPSMDVSVPLAGRPNPFVEDPILGAVVAYGMRDKVRGDIPVSKQAVVLMNHHVRQHQQYFDPKIDDTLILNQNVRAAIKSWFPEMDENNIMGAWFGRKTVNPANGQYERSREMRGEALGDAFLYETNEVLPSGLDGWLYWDALEELKSRGIEHIIIVFPQIVTSSVLSLVEVHNEIAKEIGYKTWYPWYTGTMDFDNYPTEGHPFADYWQPGAQTMCRLPGSSDNSVKEPCCFEMGGCMGSAQPYPPERQTLLTAAMATDDPHLVYDVPEYGHLGYVEANGAPDPNAPVQDQYTGTWIMWTPPDDRPGLGTYLALKVFQHLFPTP